MFVISDKTGTKTVIFDDFDKLYKEILMIHSYYMLNLPNKNEILESIEKNNFFKYSLNNNDYYIIKVEKIE